MLPPMTERTPRMPLMIPRLPRELLFMTERILRMPLMMHRLVRALFIPDGRSPLEDAPTPLGKIHTVQLVFSTNLPPMIPRNNHPQYFTLL